MMRSHALRDWPVWYDTVRYHAPLLVLTDFDGTLTPIVPTPDQARLPAGMKRILRALSLADGIQVGVVSGRSVSGVRQLIRLRGLVYVGNHGLEIQGPRVRFVHPAAARAIPVLRRIAARGRAALREIRGAIVESKRLSLSIHYRLVNASRLAQFQRCVRRALAPWVGRRSVRVTRGKRVIEVRPPVAWHKGSAVDWLMKAYRCRRGAVIYVGDDRTDEDAFRAVNRHRGISIVVGPPRQASAARWRLNSPDEVGKMFALIVAERRRTQRARSR